jgi:hypothetical protein
MFRLNRCLPLVALAFLATILLTSCDYPYDVETDVGPVPPYCQKQGNWCGAASAQMIIHFCCAEKASPAVTPSWYAGRTLTEKQNYIQGKLDIYHGDHSIGLPNKHPDAVKQIIMDEKEGAPGHFVVFHDVDSSKVMHDMCYWMKEAGYPSATIVKGCHCVVVYRFRTDPEPTLSNMVSLLDIGIIDPSHPSFCPGGTVVEDASHKIPSISEEGWASNYWYTAVTCWSGEKYNGEYVAVVEPPETTGMIRIKKPYVGKKEEIILVESAIEKARGYVQSRELTKFKVLNFLADAWPETALLVEWTDQDRYYYLVPFVTEKGGVARAIMILNAYNGNYHECGPLRKPISFVSKDEAVKLALLKMEIKRYKRVDAKLKYIYSDLSYSHYYPFWEVNVDGKLYYVGQDREVHKELKLTVKQE